MKPTAAVTGDGRHVCDCHAARVAIDKNAQMALPTTPRVATPQHPGGAPCTSTSAPATSSRALCGCHARQHSCGKHGGAAVPCVSTQGGPPQGDGSHRRFVPHVQRCRQRRGAGTLVFVCAVALAVSVATASPYVLDTKVYREASRFAKQRDYERARALLEAELLVLQSTRPSSGSAQHHHHMTPATVGGSGNAMTEMDQHVAHYTHLLATMHAKLQNEALARGYYASACRKLEAFYGVHHGYAKNCVKEQTAFLTQIGETFEAATVKKQALVRRLSDSKNAKTGDRAKSGKASKSRGRSRSGKAPGVSSSQASPPNDFVAAKDRMEALAGEYGGADAIRRKSVRNRMRRLRDWLDKESKQGHTMPELQALASFTLAAMSRLDTDGPATIARDVREYEERQVVASSPAEAVRVQHELAVLRALHAGVPTLGHSDPWTGDVPGPADDTALGPGTDGAPPVSGFGAASAGTAGTGWDGARSGGQQQAPLPPPGAEGYITAPPQPKLPAWAWMLRDARYHAMAVTVVVLAGTVALVVAMHDTPAARNMQRRLRECVAKSRRRGGTSSSAAAAAAAAFAAATTTPSGGSGSGSGSGSGGGKKSTSKAKSKGRNNGSKTRRKAAPKPAPAQPSSPPVVATAPPPAVPAEMPSSPVMQPATLAAAPAAAPPTNKVPASTPPTPAVEGGAATPSASAAADAPAAVLSTPKRRRRRRGGSHKHRAQEQGQQQAQEQGQQQAQEQGQQQAPEQGTQPTQPASPNPATTADTADNTTAANATAAPVDDVVGAAAPIKAANDEVVTASAAPTATAGDGVAVKLVAEPTQATSAPADQEPHTSPDEPQPPGQDDPSYMLAWPDVEDDEDDAVFAVAARAGNATATDAAASPSEGGAANQHTAAADAAASARGGATDAAGEAAGVVAAQKPQHHGRGGCDDNQADARSDVSGEGRSRGSAATSVGLSSHGSAHSTTATSTSGRNPASTAKPTAAPPAGGATPVVVAKDGGEGGESGDANAGTPTATTKKRRKKRRKKKSSGNATPNPDTPTADSAQQPQQSQQGQGHASAAAATTRGRNPGRASGGKSSIRGDSVSSRGSSRSDRSGLTFATGSSIALGALNHSGDAGSVTSTASASKRRRRRKKGRSASTSVPGSPRPNSRQRNGSGHNGGGGANQRGRSASEAVQYPQYHPRGGYVQPMRRGVPLAALLPQHGAIPYTYPIYHSEAGSDALTTSTAPSPTSQQRTPSPPASAYGGSGGGGSAGGDDASHASPKWTEASAPGTPTTAAGAPSSEPVPGAFSPRYTSGYSLGFGRYGYGYYFVPGAKSHDDDADADGDSTTTSTQPSRHAHNRPRAVSEGSPRAATATASGGGGVGGGGSAPAAAAVDAQPMTKAPTKSQPRPQIVTAVGSDHFSFDADHASGAGSGGAGGGDHMQAARHSPSKYMAWPHNKPPLSPKPGSPRSVVSSPARRSVSSMAQLLSYVKQQMEFYFSARNLRNDWYLRQRMDGNGWIYVTVVANFNRVRELTNLCHTLSASEQRRCPSTKGATAAPLDVAFAAVLDSRVLEVDGTDARVAKVRLRDSWQSWLLPQQPHARAHPHAHPHPRAQQPQPPQQPGSPYMHAGMPPQPVMMSPTPAHMYPAPMMAYAFSPSSPHQHMVSPVGAAVMMGQPTMMTPVMPPSRDSQR